MPREAAKVSVSPPSLIWLLFVPLLLLTGCTLGPAAAQTPAAGIPGPATVQVRVTVTPQPVGAKITTATIRASTVTPSIATATATVTATPSPHPAGTAEAAATAKASYDQKVATSAAYETTFAAGLTAQAATRATATAQAEATRQSMPTPSPWTASAGLWIPEPATELQRWAGPPISAGEAITVSNSSSVEALGRWGKGRATALAWSPDGRWLAVGTPAGVYLHDAQTFEEVHSLQIPAAVSGLAFSPDGTLLAAALGDTVQVWQTETWQRVQGLLGGGERVAFSADGHLLASGSADSAVYVWRVDTWQEVQVLANAGYEVAFSPDSTLLASSDDETIRLWGVDDWRQVRVLYTGRKTIGSYRLSFSPDGTLLAAAGTSLIRGKCEPELCTGGRIWVVATGELLVGLRRYGTMDQGPVSVAFSPDGSQLAVGYWSGAVQLVRTDAPYGDFLPGGHAGPVLQMGFSADGSKFASLGADGAVQIRETATPQVVHALAGYLDQVRQVALSPRGGLLAIGVGEEHWCQGSGTALVLVGEVRTGQAVRVWKQGTYSVQSIGFSPDGATLAVGGTCISTDVQASSQVQLWAVSDGSELWGLEGYAAQLSALAFSPDGTHIAAGTSEPCPLRDCYRVRTWEVLSGRDVDHLNLLEPVESLALSPNGTLAAVNSPTMRSYWPTCTTRDISFWDLATGRFVGSFQWVTGSGMGSGIVFSPDGALLAAGAADGTAYVWKVPTGHQEAAAMQGHAGAVKAVAFSPDGTLLVSGSADGTVRLWEVATGRRLRTLHGHVGAVDSVAFSPDGTYFVSGGWDGTVRLWGIPQK